MKIAALFCVAASLTLTFAPAVASADEPSKPVSGKAPPEPPPAGDEDAKPEKDPNDKPAEPVFDMQGFQRERASDDIIAKVREKCFASPMSREGMSPAETRVCNAEVAKLERSEGRR